jgi:hypothetical protein
MFRLARIFQSSYEYTLNVPGRRIAVMFIQLFSDVVSTTEDMEFRMEVLHNWVMMWGE